MVSRVRGFSLVQMCTGVFLFFFISRGRQELNTKMSENMEKNQEHSVEEEEEASSRTASAFLCVLPLVQREK